MAAQSCQKLRVLMLHGYTSNSFIFSKRTGAIRKACRDVADLVFVNGPHLVQPITAAGNLDAPEHGDNAVDQNTPLEEQPRAWWKASDDGKYEGWDETVEFLNKVIKEEGPFDGVWGFSQGACLAGILASGFENPGRIPGLRLPESQKPFRFAIAISGFRSRDEVHRPCFEEKIQTPVLHVLGREDQIVDGDRSQTLIDACANMRVERHDGGHAVPTQAAWRNFFADFLRSFSSEPVDDSWKAVTGPSERPKGPEGGDHRSASKTGADKSSL